MTYYLDPKATTTAWKGKGCWSTCCCIVFVIVLPVVAINSQPKIQGLEKLGLPELPCRLVQQVSGAEYPRHSAYFSTLVECPESRIKHLGLFRQLALQR
jgi:hypothetical protein